MKEGFRQAMAWLHTWAGLIFGWLLFAIFLTGTLAYFKDEITHWMQPEVQAHPLDDGRSLAVAQNYLQQQAPTAARWFITLPTRRDPGLSVMWQDKLEPGKRGTFIQKVLDPVTGQPVQARESKGGEFFYRFHFQLQMPYPWGRWLSTIAAMVMFVALITGIITHKKIFKDFFTFRPRKGQRSWLDGHNAVGVLVLPFHLMITYSSLVIFMSMVMPAPIVASYGDDSRAFFSELFPATDNPPALGQPGKLLPLMPMYQQAREHWGAGMWGVWRSTTPPMPTPPSMCLAPAPTAWCMPLAVRCRSTAPPASCCEAVPSRHWRRPSVAVSTVCTWAISPARYCAGCTLSAAWRARR